MINERFILLNIDYLWLWLFKKVSWAFLHQKIGENCQIWTLALFTILIILRFKFRLPFWIWHFLNGRSLESKKKVSLSFILVIFILAGKLTGQSQKGKCAWVVPFVENHFHSQEKKEDVEMKKESSAIFHQPPERILITRYLLFLQTFYPSRLII